MPTLLTPIHPAQNLRGNPEPRPSPPKDLSQSVAKPDMKYEPIQEVTNEYVTQSGVKLLFQIASLSVSRTNKSGPVGDPIYLVNAQTNVQVVQQNLAE